ncbi:MAG TPA: methylenetetrahydrofolate reductase C-terminal domain-containing protein [Desulfobacterales bacterium]|nr:methylenetetrahydrofolate reductase C-terminal domain-containing protein [Desulfobacterales bacterium]
MVKGKRKPLEEIKSFIDAYNNILIVGCGGCVSVCMAGGQKETNVLKADLNRLYKPDKTRKCIKTLTIERQCNMQFLAELDEIVQEHDCLLSMACGAGVQYLAERFTEKPVFPAINTVGIGVDRGIGIYEEKCRACGECMLAYTGGICPVTRCAKGLFNGPCGGTQKGLCEVSMFKGMDDVSCAWYDIYERLKKQNRLDCILKIKNPPQWQDQVQRTIVQEPYEDRYLKKVA